MILALTVVMVIVGMAMYSASELGEFERRADAEAQRRLTVVEAVHVQAMLSRLNKARGDPAIKTLDGAIEAIDKNSPDMKVWLFMGPKVLRYQKRRDGKTEPPRDAVDREAIELKKPVGRVQDGYYRYSKPVILGQGKAGNARCFICHGGAMRIKKGEVIGGYAIALSLPALRAPLVANLKRLFAGVAILIFIVLVASFLLIRQSARALDFKSRLLQMVLDHVDEGISFCGKTLKLDMFNSRFLELLQFPADKFQQGDALEDFIRFNAERGEYGPGDIEEQVRERVELAHGCAAHRFERTRPDGTVIEITGKPVEDFGLVTTYRDITEKATALADLGNSKMSLQQRVKELENLKTQLERKSDEATRIFDKLRESRNIQADAINNISEGFALWSDDDRLIIFNNQLVEIFSELEDIIEIGVSYETIIRTAYERDIYETPEGDFDELIAERVASHRNSVISRDRQMTNGRWVRINERKASFGRIVGVITDITERRSAELAIKRLAETDVLTGLPNRARFQDHLEQAIENARRTGREVGVMLLDIDNFKDVNDTLGHHAGDKLLCEVAKRILGCIRTTDSIARLGGDEFAVIATNLTGALDIKYLAERMVTSLGKPMEIGGQNVHTGASIGISIFPDDSGSENDLLRDADIALYRAKDAGRGVYRLFDNKMNAEVQKRHALEENLRRAMAEDELVLNYQPQVRIPDGRIIGAEALLRWEHPVWGMVSPDEFIPVAEATRLIIPLGEWVLRTACHRARQWQLDGLSPIVVAVNVSPRQFKHQDMVDSVRKALDEAKLDPQWLEIEITEGIAMETDVADTFRALKDLGVGLSIDDFGTGYSSLSRLKDFPVDRLKIDKSFVQSIDMAPDHRAISAAIVHLGHSLNLKIIAEGVETMPELDQLVELGCDEAQGYLFSPALPPKQFAEFLKIHDRDQPGHISLPVDRAAAC